MTHHQARRERRAAERKAKKIEMKKNRALDHPKLPIDLSMEEESSLQSTAPREVSISANSGFVSQTAAQPSRRAEINRANAQHSTGPVTASGKMASSRNSLKHGLASGEIIIPGEDPAAFDALLHDLLEEHQPANTTAELLIKEMAQSYWLTQRAIRLQTECFSENGVDEKRLALFLRYQTTHERAFHKTLTTLLQLRRGEARLARGFVSQQPSNIAETEPGRRSGPAEIGFVSQNPLNPLEMTSSNGKIPPREAGNLFESIAEAA